MKSTEPKNPNCPICRIPYETVLTDFHSRGVIVRNVSCYVCPRCKREVFSIDQAQEIEDRIYALAPRLSLKRKISSAAGKKPILYLPKEILEAMGLKIGDSVTISLQGNKTVLVPA